MALWCILAILFFFFHRQSKNPSRKNNLDTKAEVMLKHFLQPNKLQQVFTL